MGAQQSLADYVKEDDEQYVKSGTFKDGTLTLTKNSGKDVVVTGFNTNVDLSAYSKTGADATYAKTSDLSAYAKTSDLAPYVKTTYIKDKDGKDVIDPYITSSTLTAKVAQINVPEVTNQLIGTTGFVDSVGASIQKTPDTIATKLSGNTGFQKKLTDALKLDADFKKSVKGDPGILADADSVNVNTLNVKTTLDAKGVLKVAGTSSFAGTSTFSKLATFNEKTDFNKEANFDKKVTINDNLNLGNNGTTPKWGELSLYNADTKLWSHINRKEGEYKHIFRGGKVLFDNLPIPGSDKKLPARVEVLGELAADRIGDDGTQFTAGYGGYKVGYGWEDNGKKVNYNSEVNEFTRDGLKIRFGSVNTDKICDKKGENCINFKDIITNDSKISIKNEQKGNFLKGYSDNGTGLRDGEEDNWTKWTVYKK